MQFSGCSVLPWSELDSNHKRYHSGLCRGHCLVLVAAWSSAVVGVLLVIRFLGDAVLFAFESTLYSAGLILGIISGIA